MGQIKAYDLPPRRGGGGFQIRKKLIPRTQAMEKGFSVTGRENARHLATSHPNTSFGQASIKTNVSSEFQRDHPKILFQSLGTRQHT